MKRSISVLAVLGLVGMGICLPGVAQAIEERIIQVRSLEVAPEAPPEVCERGATLLGIEDRDLPDDTVQVEFDADLWSIRTRANNGTVVNSETRKVGTAFACGWVSLSELFGNLAEPMSPIDPTQPFPVLHLYGEFKIGDMNISAGGECLLSSNTIPVPYLGLVGCSLLIPPDEEQGLLGGNAASHSVFNPLDLPGFQTGSFWTIHIYTE